YNSREHGDPERMDPDGKEVVDNSDDTNFKKSLLWGIYKPSAFQQRTIIPCIKDPKGDSGTWRLYGSNLSCLHWWNKCSK
uniref:Uncharacterized protein n=1 Tax=Gorilla gorilla gorilla TaxID=9595 RepID=A0A2I2YK56_GORGO